MKLPNLDSVRKLIECMQQNPQGTAMFVVVLTLVTVSALSLAAFAVLAKVPH